jgi:predicted transcriptional regulator
MKKTEKNILNEIKNTNNFGFGKLDEEGKKALTMIRVRIAKEMAEYESLIGFKNFEDMVKTLSLVSVNVCRDLAGESAKENGEAFENFVKLVMSDIMMEMARTMDWVA